MQVQGTPLLTRLNSSFDALLPLPRLLKTAFLCGALPLFIGTLIFVFWLLTRWGELMAAGVLIIILGLIWFVIGVICVIVHLLRSGGPEAAPSQGWKPALILSLLLANFPVVYFYLNTVDELLTRYTVVVINDSQQPIESLFIKTGGQHTLAEFKPIASGQSAKRHFSVSGTPLDFTARQNQSGFGGSVDSYAFSDGKQGKIIRIKSPGTYELESYSPN